MCCLVKGTSGLCRVCDGQIGDRESGDSLMCVKENMHFIEARAARHPSYYLKICYYLLLSLPPPHKSRGRAPALQVKFKFVRIYLLFKKMPYCSFWVLLTRRFEIVPGYTVDSYYTTATM